MNTLLWLKFDGIIGEGKKNDVFYKIAERCIQDPNYQPRVVTINLTRTTEEYVSFALLEALKDGRVASSKFKSVDICIEPPHIIITANAPPKKIEALSLDRWSIWRINEDYSTTLQSPQELAYINCGR